MMCGSLRISRESENSKFALSTLRISSCHTKEWSDIQRELLVHTSTILENDVGCSDIINPIIKRDAKECVLIREGDAQAFDTEYWMSAQYLKLGRAGLPFTNTVPEALPVLASLDRNRLNSAACSFYLVSSYRLVEEKGCVPYQKAA